MTVLHGTATVLRSVRDDDAEVLAGILAEPEVAQWWPRYDLQRVRDELLGASESVVFAVEVEGEVIGSIQYVEEPAPDYRHAGIDVFLSARWHGKGLGTDAVRTLARHLVHDRGHHRLAIDPAVANERAIRTYERVGFRRVGIMRRYERGSDGRWHDCLLMELLAEHLH
ncbi:MAG: GNAT family N-acetyltransferase [Euzebyales bacterium]|nr:GNAT family N-acetyltransferase [Euzebyales bacterium]